MIDNNTMYFFRDALEKQAGGAIRQIAEKFKRGHKDIARRYLKNHKLNFAAEHIKKPGVKKYLQQDVSGVLPRNLREFQTAGKTRQGFFKRVDPEMEGTLRTFEKWKNR